MASLFVLPPALVNNGWIKLHRKLLNNDELFGTQYSFAVFTLLLLMADSNGKVTTGRIEISKMLRAKESTIYKTLKRLEKQHQISMQSNSKGTVISICNWDKYQQQSNNKVTPKVSEKEQQSNTIYKGEELRIKNRERVLNFVKLFNEIKGTKYSNVDNLIDNFSYWIEKYSPTEIKQAIQNSELDEFWKTALSPEKLLRRKGKNGEPCDRIAELLNLKTISKDHKPTQPEGDFARLLKNL